MSTEHDAAPQPGVEELARALRDQGEDLRRLERELRLAKAEVRVKNEYISHLEAQVRRASRWSVARVPGRLKATLQRAAGAGVSRRAAGPGTSLARSPHEPDSA